MKKKKVIIVEQDKHRIQPCHNPLCGNLLRVGKKRYCIRCSKAHERGYRKGYKSCERKYKIRNIPIKEG